MADEQIIVDIKIEDKEIKEAEKSFDRLTDSIEELGKVIIDAKKNNKQYKKTIAELDKALDAGTLSAESHKKQTKLLNDEIKKNNIQVAKSSVELSKQKRERTANIKLINSEKGFYDKLNARLVALRKTAKNLGAQFGTNSKQFKTAASEVSKLDSKLRLIDNELGNNQRSVGKYSNALKGLAGQLLGALGITAGVTLLVDQFKKAAERMGILNVLTRQLKGTFDITTKEAQKLAAQINAMAQNFEDVDAKQLQISLVAIVNTFKELSEQEALDLIKEGFQKGSNNSGEFLDILKEYPVFFKKAGLSASEMFAIINQQVKEGVYSDKGVDAIKEATISLTENTKIVKDALKPLGESVNLQIRQKVEAGKAFEAMQLISKEMLTLGANSAEAQTIMADVFKGAGEDSDAFVRNLHNVVLSMEDVADQTSIVSSANLELSTTYNEFLLSVSQGDGIFSRSIANFKLWVSEIFTSLKVFNEADITTRLKQMANGLAAITGVGADYRFEINEETEALKLQQNEITKNTRLVKDLTKVEETAAEKTKRLAKEKKKLADQERKLAKERADEAKRFEAAENKLIELDNKRRITGIENAEKLRDERIKIEAETLVRSLENQELLDIEREVLIQQSAENIAKINQDFIDLEIKQDEEKLKRQQDANETIQEIEEEAILVKIENAEELKNKLIEFEMARRAFLLENENLIKEEKEAIILESETKIKEIEQAFADEKEIDETERLEKRKQVLEGFFSDLIGITGRFAGDELAIFSKVGAGIAKAFEDGKITAESAIQAIGMISNALFDNIAARREKDLSDNEKAREAELALHEGNEVAQSKINEEFDKKSAALKLKQFNADKAKTLIEIGIATALGVIKAAAALPIPPFPFAIAIGALGLIQAGFVATKKPPTFAEGTGDIVNIGGSHASGNDVDVFGVSGGQEQYFGKVEKGEAMPVIRKSAANDYMIAKLNGRFSSRGRTFQGGTPDITNEGQTQNNEVFVSQLVNAFSNIQIVAKIEDITKEAGRKIEIVDNSKV